MTGGFKEARSRQITLSEDEPSIFEVFAAWVYSGRLYDPKDASLVDRKSEIIANRTSVNLSDFQLVKRWTFRDCRGIPALQNQVINEIRRSFVETWSVILSAIDLAYKSTIDGAKLRKLFVELEVLSCDSVFAKDDGIYNHRFMCELCDRFVELSSTARAVKKKDSVTKVDLCPYHINDDVDCKGQKIEKPVVKAAINNTAIVASKENVPPP